MGSFVSVSSTQELGIVKLTDRSEEDSLDSVTIHSNCLPSTVPTHLSAEWFTFVDTFRVSETPCEGFILH